MDTLEVRASPRHASASVPSGLLLMDYTGSRISAFLRWLLFLFRPRAAFATAAAWTVEGRTVVSRRPTLTVRRRDTQELRRPPQPSGTRTPLAGLLPANHVNSASVRTIHTGPRTILGRRRQGYWTILISWGVWLSRRPPSGTTVTMSSIRTPNLPGR